MFSYLTAVIDSAASAGFFTPFKVTKDFERVREWRAFAPFVTRCLFTPVFPVPWMESILPLDLDKHRSAISKLESESLEKEKGCYVCNAKEAKSGGKLMICTGCRKVTYCSQECQKKDWKQHKIICKA